MGRNKKLIPSIALNVHLPTDLHAKLTLHLYSELEQRVPMGAYQEFLSARIREYFENKQLDLAPFIPNTTENAWVVSGNTDAILGLKFHLMKGEGK